MGTASLDGANRRNERLGEHLSSEDPLPARLGTVPAKEIHLEILEVEEREQAIEFGRHLERS